MCFPEERSEQLCSSAAPVRRPSATSRHQNARTAERLLQRQPRMRRNPPLAALCLCLAAASVLCPTAEGLACYETVNGKTTIVQSDSWIYCALVPATMVGSELVNGSQFGLGPDNDMMAAYNTAFSMSADEYRILTVCIYERYDFSRFLTIKPDLAVEFAFRCVCNYDLCNSEPTFSAYLSAIKSESFARR